MEYGDTHSGSFVFFRNPSITKHITSLLNISLFTFNNVHGFEHISFALYFNSKYTGSVFQVPSVPSNSSSFLVTTTVIHYVVILLSAGIYFSLLYFNLTFNI